mmetsp:Transcript_66947/g.159738  ORF Transcript_66947/g.159738 Transcript_66947/m.159738 type:complete len:217 (-) Transcript_66947:36-686(-)
MGNSLRQAGGADPQRTPAGAAGAVTADLHRAGRRHGHGCHRDSEGHHSSVHHFGIDHGPPDAHLQGYLESSEAVPVDDSERQEVLALPIRAHQGRALGALHCPNPMAAHGDAELLPRPASGDRHRLLPHGLGVHVAGLRLRPGPLLHPHAERQGLRRAQPWLQLSAALRIRGSGGGGLGHHLYVRLPQDAAGQMEVACRRLNDGKPQSSKMTGTVC